MIKRNVKVETPLKYMLELDWNDEILSKSKEFLRKWDERDDSFYKGHSKLSKEVDVVEREHLRNCIFFWEKRLNNEIE